MKTAKMVIGILSIVFSLVIFFQSCAVGLGNALTNNTKDTSGAGGILVGIFFIASGVVAIAAKKSKGGAIAATVLYALAGIIALANLGTFSDLLIWGILSLIMAAFFLISIFVQKYDSPAKSAAASAPTDK